MVEFPYMVDEFEADSADFLAGRGTPRFTAVKLDVLRYFEDKVSAIDRFGVEVRLVWL
jgi:hypothetical protein